MYLDYNWMMQLIPNNSAKICHHSAAAIDSLKNSLNSAKINARDLHILLLHILYTQCVSLINYSMYIH